MSPLPQEVRIALTAFENEDRYGSLTLHFEAGKIRAFDIRQSCRVINRCDICGKRRGDLDRGWSIKKGKPYCPEHS